MKNGFEKGARGYLAHKKKVFGLATGLCLLVVAALFVTGLVVTGTRNNILTVVAVVGILPTGKFLVDFLMVVPYRQVGDDLFNALEGDCGSLLRRYECVFTTREQSFYVPALVVSDGLVLLLTHKEYPKAGNLSETMEAYARAAGCHVRVEVMSDEKQFLKKAARMDGSHGAAKDGGMPKAGGTGTDAPGRIWSAVRGMAI
jgi:hypothetical protein